MSLLMAVANDAPAPPHRVVPAVPRGLSRVILRCLAKRPEDRYASYAALAAALEPYGSVSPTPATLGRRLVAGVVDYMAVGLLTVPIIAAAGSCRRWRRRRWRQMLTNMAASVTLLLLYYGGSEALWARTPGKALLGLTLVDGGGRPPRPAVALRPCRCSSPARTSCSAWRARDLGPGVSRRWPRTSAGSTRSRPSASWLILATLFAAARRRNGYAALHDLATGMRVVERRVSTGSERPATASAPPLAAAPVVGHRGSFAVLDGTIEGRPEWRPGLDERLRRPVWIRDVPIGTPPVPAARVALPRPTRLRWLAGRRTAQEAWDVYEGVAGVPIAQACRAPPAVVRGAALAGRPRARAGRAAAGRPAAARSRSRLDPGLGAGQAARRSDRRRPDCRRPVTVRPAHVRRRSAARGRACWRAPAASQPWPVAASHFADRLSEAPPASLTDVAQRRGRAAARPGRGDARLARPVARRPSSRCPC